MTSLIDRAFGVSAAGSRVSIEIRAGVTTFLSMAYIIFVNPQIMGQAIVIPGVDNVAAQLLTSTALAAAFGSMMMGLVARYPIAVAPGMGLNAYFTFTVVLGLGVPWTTALGAVFVSGMAFLVLSLTGAREAIVNGIPLSIKRATASGIGCFLAMIGAVNTGLVVDKPSTLVGLGNFQNPSVLLAMAGLALIAILMATRVRGAMLIGILAISAAAIITRAPVFGGQAFGGFSDGVVSVPVWPVDIFARLDIPGALSLGVFSIVFTFLFVDFFDTAGTLIGLAEKAGFMDRTGRIPRAMAVFSTDAVATTMGAFLGTSANTAYVESAAGIEDGGKTGLTAVVVGLLFLASLFFWPLAGMVPSCATAPVLMILGAMMMESAARIDWQDLRESVPGFLTMIGMPLTFSISNGITLGIVSYALIHVGTGRWRQVHPVMYGLAILLAARLAWMGE